MEKCPHCGRTLVTLETDLGGETVTMRSCSACDTRTWTRNGEPVDLRDVLDLTESQRTPKVEARRPSRR